MRAAQAEKLLIAGNSFAEDEYLHGRTAKKFKRGLINLVTAPVEIPKNMKDQWEEGGGHPFEKVVSLFGGFVKGTAYTIGRLGSGLWDVVTLNWDIPGNNEPLMKPDYVLGDRNE